MPYLIKNDVNAKPLDVEWFFPDIDALVQSFSSKETKYFNLYNGDVMICHPSYDGKPFYAIYVTEDTRYESGDP